MVPEPGVCVPYIVPVEILENIFDFSQQLDFGVSDRAVDVIFNRGLHSVLQRWQLGCQKLGLI